MKQYKPEEVIYAIDETEYLIFITSEKYFVENGYMDDEVELYENIDSLIKYENVAENIYHPSKDQTPEEVREHLNKIGLKHSDYFQKFIERKGRG